MYNKKPLRKGSGFAFFILCVYKTNPLPCIEGIMTTTTTMTVIKRILFFTLIFIDESNVENKFFKEQYILIKNTALRVFIFYRLFKCICQSLFMQIKLPLFLRS